MQELSPRLDERNRVRITSEEGLSASIVEQHPQAILKICHSLVLLEFGHGVPASDAAAPCEKPPNVGHTAGLGPQALN